MVDLAIGAAISGLKTAGEMVGSFVKLRDEAMIQAKVIELQSVILTAQGNALAAQGEQFALLETKRDLEKQIADLEAWQREKERYQLTSVGAGVVAFVLKADSQGSEPIHMLCANCVQHGRASHLQYNGRIGRGGFECLACKTNITVSSDRMRELGIWPPL